jgi:methionyl-tRNA synthetase
MELWPADLHLIGKEIVRFHAVYWPAFLMAAGLPLPKRIFAHGWLLFEESKMSKSRGNIVRAAPIRQVVGADGLRYFLLREIVFGQDGSFSYDALINRYNAELANGLGNLASRTLTMIGQYRGGADAGGFRPIGDRRRGRPRRSRRAAGCFDRFEFSRGLEARVVLISAVDKYIVQQAPWKLARRARGAEAARRYALYRRRGAAHRRRAGSARAAESTLKIWAQLGLEGSPEGILLDNLGWGQLGAGTKTGPVAAVYPRLDVARSVEEMRRLEEVELARQQALLGRKPADAEGAAAEAPSGRIGIEDFAKVDMRVGLVLEARAVPKSDKLLELKVDVGELGPRTVVAGIAEAYKPEEIVGRKVVVVVNLQPRKMRGIESNGMIVAASIGDGKPVLAGFHEEIPAGARLT